MNRVRPRKPPAYPREVFVFDCPTRDDCVTFIHADAFGNFTANQRRYVPEFACCHRQGGQLDLQRFQGAALLMKVNEMANLFWRIRCAYWFVRRLGLGWSGQVWGLAGALLDNEIAQQKWHDSRFQSPRRAVSEELSCWSE